MRKDVKFLAFGSRGTDLGEEWLRLPCDESTCTLLARALFSDSSNAVLIDDSLQLRRSYDLGQEEELHKLIEHGAILFPTEKREKIELIRDK